MVIRRCKDGHDTAYSAILRRADNPNECSAAWQYLVPFCDITDERQRICFELVGAAVARGKPEIDGKYSVGGALRIIRQKNGSACSDEDDGETRRFRRLIACVQVQQLIPVLRPVLRYIQGGHAQLLNYEDLLKDILYWNENVRISWTKDFYGQTDSAEGEQE